MKATTRKGGSFLCLALQDDPCPCIYARQIRRINKGTKRGIALVEPPSNTPTATVGNRSNPSLLLLNSAGIDTKKRVKWAKANQASEHENPC